MKQPPTTPGRLLALAATFALIGSLAAQPATSTSTRTSTPTPSAITPAIPANPAVTTPVTPANPAAAAATPPTPVAPSKADAPAKQPKIVSKNDPSVVTAPALNLPRLQTRTKPGDLTRMASNHVTVDKLSPQGSPGAKAVTKGALTYLTINSGKDFSSPIRSKANDPTFVSFFVYASDGTTFDIGGARLAIKATTKPGYAQLFVSENATPSSPLRALPEFVRIETHDKAALAALPVLTVRLDPKAKVWDLYSFNRLVAEDLPLTTAPTRGNQAKEFSLTAGKAGASIHSLVSSDENPLFADLNNNGIDDKFERTKRTHLLDDDNTAADRSKMVHDWKAHQTATKLKPWSIQRPLPDGVVAAAPPPKN
jgi:hypothetical protein